jgi:hypothetical protein
MLVCGAPDPPTPAPQASPYTEQVRGISSRRLTVFGRLLAAYAAQNNGNLLADLSPDNLAKLSKYTRPEDYRDGSLDGFVLQQMEYLPAGAAGESPATAMIAYDRNLLQIDDGTHALFADWHVEFVAPDRFAALGIKALPRLEFSQGQSYPVEVPREWRPYIKAGDFTVVGAPFPGVDCQGQFFAAWPHVRVRWSLTNLTSEPVEVAPNYKARSVTGGSQTGHGPWYRLAPLETRWIDDIIPVMSLTIPQTVCVKAYGSTQFVDLALRHGGQAVPLEASHTMVTTDLVLPGDVPADNVVTKDGMTARITVVQARLAISPAGGNVLQVELSNRADAELPVLVAAAAVDTARTQRGGWPETGQYVETVASIKPGPAQTVNLPYSIPASGPNPTLAFTVFEPLGQAIAPVNPVLHGREDVTPVCWGWFNLPAAAARGLARLPRFEPVQERVKLTEEKRSVHFIFRFRPGSYAQQHIDEAVCDREEAYQSLSAALGMELPQVVAIDLYPDMEAKGIGSGTYSTPANTVTNTHIAEVYNDNYRCDRYHELAHLFSYNIPGKGTAGHDSGLVEAFADYFEAGNAQRLATHGRARLAKDLEAGKLPPLGKLVLGSSSDDSQGVLLAFLFQDASKCKRFYIGAISKARTIEDLEALCQDVYGMSLTQLEQQWHAYLRQEAQLAPAETPSSGPAAGDSQAPRGDSISTGGEWQQR